MKFKKNRAASFFAVTLIYLFASAAGIAMYLVLPYAWWINLLLADVFATVIVFLFSLIFNNASVYDPYWSIQPIVIVGAFAVENPLTGYGILLLLAVFLWGIRLTANWAYTFQNLEWQDWRYTMLKEQTGAFYPLVNLAGIHMVPTLIVWLCILPAAAALREGVTVTPPAFVFLLLSFGAVVLQGVSDYQMHVFRKEKTGGFIRSGLWTYSRHPNYLAEILMWWGIGLSVVSVSPGQIWLLSGALANTMLFLFISIPMADRHQSRKPGFEQYKAETRMLLPVKKK